MIDAKSFFAGIFFSMVLIALFFGFSGQGKTKTLCAHAEPVFSPGSEDEIISLVKSSEKSIDLQMYVFTNEKIANALIDAVKRGVEVRVILEARVNSYNLDEISNALEDGGVQLRWASFEYKLTHSKMMIIDGEKVLVGSINFSHSAVNKNREVGAILEGDEVLEFIEVFQKDWKKATELK